MVLSATSENWEFSLAKNGKRAFVISPLRPGKLAEKFAREVDDAREKNFSISSIARIDL